MIPWWVGLALAGELSGQVVDNLGAPVVGATVVAYDQRLSYAVDTTDASGTYVLDDLPANPYRVRVIPPRDENLVERYLPGSLDLCEARIYAVPGQDRVEVETAILEPGGLLSGVLLDSAGAPVVGAQLRSHASGSFDSTQPRYATSAPDGSWQIRGLALDSGSDYRVEVEVEGWPDQFLEGFYEEEDAPPWSFAEDSSLHTGDMTLLDGIAVTGQVRGPSGPVTSGMVQIYTPSQIVNADIGADGTYEAIGLPPGDVLAWAAAEGLGTTYYPDADRPATRIPAPEEGTIIDGVDLALPLESRLSGRILGEGDLSEVTVLLYNDDRTVAVNGTVDADGFFEVGALHAGAYTLQVYGEDEGLASDRVREADGTERIFEVGEATDVDVGEIAVPAAATLAGRVRDRYGGKGIYGAFVYAQDEDSGDIHLAVSGEGGRYAMEGLVGGTYRIWSDYQHYCEPDADWVPLYWPDSANPVLNGSVRLQAGEAAEWDPLLPPDADHDAMDDSWEEQWGLDPHRDDGDEDPDTDGFTNLEEYQLGTNPTDGRGNGGCGCGGGRSGLVFLFWLPWMRRRQRLAAL